MNTLNRRHFLFTLAAGLGAAAGIISLGGCQSFQPKPFIAGRTITAPQGCSQLLLRDAQGDC